MRACKERRYLLKQPPTPIAHYITVQDAVEKLGVVERTVRRWIEKDKLHAIHDASGFVRLDLSEVEQILQSKPATAPSLSQQIEALYQRIEALEAEVQKVGELQRQVEEVQHLLAHFQTEDGQLTQGPLRQQRSAHPDDLLQKRGLPPGTMRLVDFASMHEIKLSELKRLYMLREIDLEVHQRETVAVRNKQEWWITPPQHSQVITHFQQQGMLYTPCPQCQEIQEDQEG
jgi:hypothetical protein